MRSEIAARLGPVGAWLGSIALLPAAEEREAVQELERLGYTTVWIGESSSNREALAHAALLLGWTERIVVATGIASIWARDATAAANGAAALAEAYPHRFVLGLGVSHRHLVSARGQTYERPVEAMAAYLDGMDEASYVAPPPPSPAPRLLGALHPVMLRLARERADGAHPYLVSPRHTADARAELGPASVLAPEQGFVLGEDPATARAVARRHLAYYLGAPNYVRSWRRLGFSDADLEGDGSDRLVDALVACGDLDAVAARVQKHFEAGADHVALQAVAPDALAQLRSFASTLSGFAARNAP